MAGKKLWKALLMILALTTTAVTARAEGTDPLIIENRIQLNKVEIQLEEFQQIVEGGKTKRIPWEDQGQVYPGQVVSKIPVITNKGVSCYLRIRIKFSQGQSELWNQDCLVGIDQQEWAAREEKGDLVYYRREPLRPGEQTEFFQGLRIPETWGNSMSGKEVSLRLLPEAVQSNNFVQNLDSHSPWGELKIQEYQEKNHEEAYVGQEGPFLICCSPLAMELIASPEGLFFLNFNDRTPGDVLTGEIQLSNQWDQTAEMFLKLEAGENKTPEARELLEAISMKLTVAGDDGRTQTVYQGPLLPPQGQYQMSLGRFPPGYGGKLKMEAKIPGELDNTFTLTDVISRWTFWTSLEEPVVWVPKTGDHTSGEPFLVCGFVSLCLMAGGLMLYRRKRQ